MNETEVIIEEILKYKNEANVLINSMQINCNNIFGLQRDILQLFSTALSDSLISWYVNIWDATIQYKSIKVLNNFIPIREKFIIKYKEYHAIYINIKEESLKNECEQYNQFFNKIIKTLDKIFIKLYDIYIAEKFINGSSQLLSIKKYSTDFSEFKNLEIQRKNIFINKLDEEKKNFKFLKDIGANQKLYKRSSTLDIILDENRKHYHAFKLYVLNQHSYRNLCAAKIQKPFILDTWNSSKLANQKHLKNCDDFLSLFDYKHKVIESDSENFLTALSRCTHEIYNNLNLIANFKPHQMAYILSFKANEKEQYYVITQNLLKKNELEIIIPGHHHLSITKQNLTFTLKKYIEHFHNSCDKKFTLHIAYKHHSIQQRLVTHIKSLDKIKKVKEILDVTIRPKSNILTNIDELNNLFKSSSDALDITTRSLLQIILIMYSKSKDLNLYHTLHFTNQFSSQFGFRIVLNDVDILSLPINFYSEYVYNLYNFYITPTKQRSERLVEISISFQQSINSLLESFSLFSTFNTPNGSTRNAIITMGLISNNMSAYIKDHFRFIYNNKLFSDTLSETNIDKIKYTTAAIQLIHNHLNKVKNIIFSLQMILSKFSSTSENEENTTLIELKNYLTPDLLLTIYPQNDLEKINGYFSKQLKEFLEADEDLQEQVLSANRLIIN